VKSELDISPGDHRDVSSQRQVDMSASTVKRAVSRTDNTSTSVT